MDMREVRKRIKTDSNLGIYSIEEKEVNNMEAVEVIYCLICGKRIAEGTELTMYENAVCEDCLEEACKDGDLI